MYVCVSFLPFLQFSLKRNISFKKHLRLVPQSKKSPYIIKTEASMHMFQCFEVVVPVLFFSSL